MFENIWELWCRLVWGTATTFVGGVSVVDFIVCLRVCMAYRDNVGHAVHWSRSLFACWLSYLGGTTLAAMIRGTPPGWALSNGPALGVILAWASIFFAPRDVVYEVVQKNKLIHRLIEFIGAINISFSIGVLGVEQSLSSAIKGSTTSVLICGIVCGCGGALLADWLNLRNETSLFRRKSPISAYVAPFMQAFTSTLLYFFVLRDPHHLMPTPIATWVKTPQSAVAILALFNLYVAWIYPNVIHLPSRILSIVPTFQEEFVPQTIRHKKIINVQADVHGTQARTNEPIASDTLNASISYFNTISNKKSEKHEIVNSNQTDSNMLQRRRRRTSSQQSRRRQ